ncbi:hypothetical protein [Natronorubrum sulfidifaciens]|uniref:DUF7974 domain-containing protein n=1 Tax=Natronorubrum sulfidifaciens JCM 14089 TaxID=1230460 RepID=L9WAD8_9EURY|nr:hypothetical protein [Natronorubrum sulfidifaciens]ELY46337.1 hypothetical protein C495_07183 [Natronorubrum sulfidifaciens JCM 14089]
MVGPQPSHDTDVDDEFGLESEDSRYTVTTFLSALVPTALARRAIAISLETEQAVYEPDESVEFTVEFTNRLPVPVAVPTPRQRRWGWTVDGDLEASDERRFTRDRPSTFRFGGGERKRVTVTWNGRLERVEEGVHESVVPEPGEYEIRAFIATRETRHQPSDAATIRIGRDTD